MDVGSNPPHVRIAGVDPGGDLEPPGAGFVPHLERGSDRPHRIVLARARGSEESEDPVAEVAIDPTAVPRHRIRHDFQRLAHPFQGRFGIQLVRRGDRAAHVREENRDEPGLVLAGGRDRQSGAALGAEPATRSGLGLAAGADHLTGRSATGRAPATSAKKSRRAA